MTSEQKAAFIIAQAACAAAEIAAMQVENQRRAQTDGRIGYGWADFMSIPDKYELGHNTVLSLFRED